MHIAFLHKERSQNQQNDSAPPSYPLGQPSHTCALAFPNCEGFQRGPPRVLGGGKGRRPVTLTAVLNTPS